MVLVVLLRYEYFRSKYASHLRAAVNYRTFCIPPLVLCVGSLPARFLVPRPFRHSERGARFRGGNPSSDCAVIHHNQQSPSSSINPPITTMVSHHQTASRVITKADGALASRPTQLRPTDFRPSTPSVCQIRVGAAVCTDIVVPGNNRLYPQQASARFAACSSAERQEMSPSPPP